MRGLLSVVCTVAAAGLVAASASPQPTASRCRATPQDAFGPFGRGVPPLRAKIGTGHVLAGVVLSALDCRPVAGAQVQFWQSDGRGRYTLRLSGTVISNQAGRFRFQGPYPVSYAGREPHIHIRVFAAGYMPLLARYVPAEGVRRGNVRLVLEPDAL